MTIDEMRKKYIIFISVIILLIIVFGFSFFNRSQTKKLDAGCPAPLTANSSPQEYDAEKRALYSEDWMEKIDSAILPLYLISIKSGNCYYGRRFSSWTMDEYLKVTPLEYSNGEIEVEIYGPNLNAKDLEIYGINKVGCNNGCRAIGKIKLDDLKKIAQISKVNEISRVSRPVPF